MKNKIIITVHLRRYMYSVLDQDYIRYRQKIINFSLQTNNTVESERTLVFHENGPECSSAQVEP